LGVGGLLFVVDDRRDEVVDFRSTRPPLTGNKLSGRSSSESSGSGRRNYINDKEERIVRRGLAGNLL
jgi:hypothetical protein